MTEHVHSGQPLHEQLFLLAYCEPGGAPVRTRRVGPGLVAAVLADLVLSNRLGRPDPLRGPDPDSPYAAAPVAGPAAVAAPAVAEVLRAIEASAQPQPAEHWMKTLDVPVHERTAASLAAAGAVSREHRRRLGAQREYVVVEDTVTAARLQTELLRVVHGKAEPGPELAILCGLAAALRLERTLDAYADAGVANALREACTAHAPLVQGIIAELEDVLAVRTTAAPLQRGGKP